MADSMLYLEGKGWTIPSVPPVLRSKESATWELSEKILPARTEREHADARLGAAADEYHAVSFPEFFAILKKIYDCRVSPAAQSAKEFILQETRAQKGTKGLAQAFLTTIEHAHGGPDIVRHDLGTSKIYKISTRLADSNRSVSSADSPDLEALLGTRDAEAVKNVFGWLTGCPTRIWGKYSAYTPALPPELLAKLVIYPDITVIYCIGLLTAKAPALGFRKIET